MMRDYRSILDLADNLEQYTGYMDTARKQEAGKVRQAFDQKRREFVYALVRDEPDPGVAWSLVTADLDRIQASGEHSYGGIDFIRAELEKHIVKQAGNGAFMRFATRWALPAVGAVATLVYFYLQMNR